VNTRGKSNNTSKDFIEYCIFPKKAGAEEIPAKEKNYSRSSAPSSLVEASWVMEYFGHGGIHQEERKC
jgi:hypothetical protein